MKKALIISLTIVACLSSCKKDNTNSTNSETTTQKIQHNWNLTSIEDIQYKGSSTTQIDTIISYGKAGDYINFSNNNKAYIRIAASNDTLPYSILNDSKIILDGDTFTINNLTSSNLKMTYYGRETNPVNYWDNVITLNR